MQEIFKASKWQSSKYFWSEMLIPITLMSCVMMGMLIFIAVKAGAQPWFFIIGWPGSLVATTCLLVFMNPEKVIVDDIGIRAINNRQTIPIRWDHIARLERRTVPIRKLGNVTIYIATGGDVEIAFANIPGYLHGKDQSAEYYRHISTKDFPQQAVFIPVKQVEALKNRIIRKGHLGLVEDGEWRKQIAVSEEPIEPWWTKKKTTPASQHPQSRNLSRDLAFVFAGLVGVIAAAFIGRDIGRDILTMIGLRAEISLFWMVLIPGMLGGASVVSGMIIGSYYALRRILGVSQDALFGYARDEAIGLVPLAILEVAGYSVLGGLIWTRVNPDRLVYGFVIGSIAGVFQTYVLKRWTRSKVIAQERTGWTSLGGLFGIEGGYLLMLVAVAVGGMFTRTRFHFWLFVGIMVILVIPGAVYIGSLLGRFASEIVTAGTVFGTGLGTGISIIAAIMTLADSGFWVAVTGVGLGAMLSFPLNMMLQWLIGVMLLLALLISPLVSAVISRLLIPIRYSTIICPHCFRYTHRFRSRYTSGVRYCEHCQREVEHTSIPGKVIVTFGTFTLAYDGKTIPLSNPHFEMLKQPDRVIIFSNPIFLKPIEQPIDVSEVYLDTNTCDRRVLERFITYIVNYPPSYGLRSVQIFYHGELDNLGENLKNALRNTFEHIEKID